MNNYIEEIKNILQSSLSNSEKKSLISQYHENDIAKAYDEMTNDQKQLLHQILDNETLGDVILYSNDIGEIVEQLDPELAADIIETMDSDDAVDVLEELDGDIRSEIIDLLENDIKEDIDSITKYQDDEIGSKMTNNYIIVSSYDTIKSAMKKVITEAADNDNVSMIYVVDDLEKLYGIIELRDLIIAREYTDIKEITKTNYPFFYATEKVEDCVGRLKEYLLDSYPIVDENDKLIGVITSDSVIETVDEEFSDDYAKLAGLTEEDEVTASVFKSVKKRIPWLIVLLILGLVQSFLMTRFEVVVATLPIIVFFQTLVLDMSGNSGTQSLAVTIRMLTNDDDKKLVYKTLLKELKVGFLNGLVLGICSGVFVFVFLYLTNQGVKEEYFSLSEALKGVSIVSIALLASMTLSSFFGALIPIVFKKMKIDPAVASGPFITTINDITALLIYYSLAALLFSLVL